jgi:hypothetical protein
MRTGAASLGTDGTLPDAKAEDARCNPSASHLANIPIRGRYVDIDPVVFLANRGWSVRFSSGMRSS